MKRNLSYPLMGLLILLGGLFLYQPLDQNTNEEQLLTYYRQWNYQGHPDAEYYTISTQGRYTYQLKTDYPTETITIPLTRKEQETIKTLIQSVITQEQPVSQTIFKEGTITGELRIPHNNYHLIFKNDDQEEAPTEAIKKLITHLQNIKEQQE